MTHQQAYQIILHKIPNDDPTIMRRLERAWSMIIGYGYEFTGPGYFNNTVVWMVEKLSSSLMEDTGASYTIADDRCTCPDFETARGGLCKHRLAVMMLTEMGEE